jgi:type IV pilus assembly protein PilB
MHAHPNADAFVRAILRDPADVATRLVFADWLEETGEPSNVAWAKYIRLMAEGERHPPGTIERENPEWRAKNLGDEIEAKVKIPAAHFLMQRELLVRLLPSHQFKVTLMGLEVPSVATEFVPESVARECRLIALAHQKPYIVVAMEDPRDWKLINSLRHNFVRDVIAVGADWDDILGTITRNYGLSGQSAPGEGETAIEQSLERAKLPEERFLDTILREAIIAGCSHVDIQPLLNGAGVWYHLRGEWVMRDNCTRRLLTRIAARVGELIGLFRELSGAGVASDAFRFDYQGASYTIHVVITPTTEGPNIYLDLSDHFTPSS